MKALLTLENLEECRNRFYDNCPREKNCLPNPKTNPNPNPNRN